MEEDIRVKSSLEIERRSTEIDIQECEDKMKDLKSRLDNPGLSEEQMKGVRTAIQNLFEELRNLQT